MHITFIGDTTTSPSIENLAELSKKNGYEVSIHGSTKNIFTIFTTMRSNTNTIHVHGWNAGFFISFFRFCIPRTTTLTLTVNSLPTGTYRRFARRVANTFDKVVVSSRTIQYQLLLINEIQSLYIPNGYTEPLLNDIEPRIFGLRNNQYGVILSQSLREIEGIMAAYTTTGSKKKMVIFGNNPSPECKKLLKKYPLLTLADLPSSSRGAQSLVRRAGFVLVPNTSYEALLLQAMDANRTIIASTSPFIEEILGTTGFYYSSDDFAHIERLLALASRGELEPKYSPALRAKHHFSWGHVWDQYEHLYTRKTVKLVPFDSLVRKAVV